MKAFATFALFLLVSGCSTKQQSPELKTLLVQQLKNSHDVQNWFAPLKMATKGLTAEQANWKDSTGNHSIGELVSHLIFWNERNLLTFEGKQLPDFKGNNDETFVRYTNTDWEEALARLDSIQNSLVEVADNATPEQLSTWSSDLGNISSHNAYHTGQIIYIRKLKGWWKGANEAQ